MMQERGLSVNHTTIYRWVQRYAPELDKRVRRYLKPVGNSTESRRDLHKDKRTVAISL